MDLIPVTQIYYEFKMKSASNLQNWNSQRHLLDPYFSILISLNKKKACCCGVLKILITFKLCSWRNIIKSSFQATVNHVADLLGNIQASSKLNVMFLSCEWRIPILFVCVCLWCLLWQWLTEARNWIFSLVLSLKVCMLLKGIVIGNCWCRWFNQV